MRTRLAHRLLIAVTILGLLLPRVSAALALAAPGVRTVVICAGDGLRTIRIDADGTPVQVSDHPDHCVLSHASDTSIRVEPAPLVARVVAGVARRPGDLIRAHGYKAARPPPRAPPTT